MHLSPLLLLLRFSLSASASALQRQGFSVGGWMTPPDSGRDSTARNHAQSLCLRTLTSWGASPTIRLPFVCALRLMSEVPQCSRCQ